MPRRQRQVDGSAEVSAHRHHPRPRLRHHRVGGDAGLARGAGPSVGPRRHDGQRVHPVKVGCCHLKHVRGTDQQGAHRPPRPQHGPPQRHADGGRRVGHDVDGEAPLRACHAEAVDHIEAHHRLVHLLDARHPLERHHRHVRRRRALAPHGREVRSRGQGAHGEPDVVCGIGVLPHEPSDVSSELKPRARHVFPREEAQRRLVKLRVRVGGRRHVDDDIDGHHDLRVLPHVRVSRDMKQPHGANVYCHVPRRHHRHRAREGIVVGRRVGAGDGCGPDDVIVCHGGAEVEHGLGGEPSSRLGEEDDGQ
mmetsp:Transcript_40715/g.79710  ORF Transcript_40715/g.79710 Transcript_40715/m.79710 type:complete len:307 (-) Transcript_40715:528-1448(-)